MSYYGNVNPDLLRFIPPDACTVLEIGCGEGALCEAYRRVNPGVRWDGVEFDQDAAAVASKRDINVFVGDVEAYDWWELTSGTADKPEVDCLIFGDVLEHLCDPWRVLEDLTWAVRPGGQVLACIPNVQHWTVIRDLLEGKWDYADAGLLDRTHLRFFTLDSIRKMFADAGLQVFEIVGRNLCNEGFDKWYDAMFPEGYGPSGKEMRAYQYVVRAAKPATLKMKNCTLVDVVASPRMHIHAVTAEACCARPRILEPFAMLGTIPGVKCTTSTSGSLNGMNDPHAPDILIFQRPRPILTVKDLAYLATQTVTITEVDDLPEAIGMDPMALKAVHAVQCSTEALAEVCRKYNPNVMVFENQIAELWPLKSSVITCDSQPELLCAWQNRESDWAPIIDALNYVLDDHPQVEVRVIHDRKFYDALTTDNKKFTPFCSYENYRHRLGQASIALLPLEDTPFNRAKSDIKFLECAAEGVAVLAGKTVYESTRRQPLGSKLARRDVMLTARTPDQWEQSLRGLIKHSDQRKELTEFAYAYVRDNRLLSQHYRRYYEWYQSLLSSKPTLDRQLFERVPELSGRLAPA